MSEFLQGFIKGAKETPRGFFAPAIALWRHFQPRRGSIPRRRGNVSPTIMQNHPHGEYLPRMGQ
jgi:hypothetical protein